MGRGGQSIAADGVGEASCGRDARPWERSFDDVEGVGAGVSRACGGKLVDRAVGRRVSRSGLSRRTASW